VAAHLGAELGAHGLELVDQRLFEQRRVQRRPGAVELDQPVDRDRVLLDETARARDQRAGLGGGFAPLDGFLPARLRGAMQALVVIAELARGALERFLLAQGRDRGELELDRGRLARELEQGAVVAVSREDPVPPGLQLGVVRDAGRGATS
jgi:hypothetical protein